MNTTQSKPLKIGQNNSAMGIASAPVAFARPPEKTARKYMPNGYGPVVTLPQSLWRGGVS